MQFLNAFDRAMNMLDEKFKFLASSKQIVSSTDEADKVKLATISNFYRITLIQCTQFPCSNSNNFIFWSMFVTGHCLWTGRSDICVQLPPRKYLWRVCSFILQLKCLTPGYFREVILDYIKVCFTYYTCSVCRYKVGCDLPGKYKVALDSDAWEFGGPGRVRTLSPETRAPTWSKSNLLNKRIVLLRLDW